MAGRRDRKTPEQIVRLCEAHFGEKVEKVTAPGGRSRDSLRVHFAGRTIIATERKYPGRMRLEAEILRRLGRGGAPTPELLGQVDGILFQADAGQRRLSGELAGADAGRRSDLARRAIASLSQIQEVGAAAGLGDLVPPLGVNAGWVRGLIGNVAQVSLRLGVPPPALDTDALTEALDVPAERFLKWDARPGNASVAGDGRVIWFDWEHSGRRQGMEDFAWLAGDEFWPLGPDQVAGLIGELLPAARRDADLRYLCLFAPFHIAQRLGIIRARFDKAGWADPETALRYDRIGVDPGLIRRLCRHGAGWAGRDPLSRPLSDWFDACGATLDRNWTPPERLESRG